ncbi:hypothetical protein O3M35_000849 [Rhynocoris fuscipes]|uniref:Gustatory receptor n=1 Tax=Rhynocoris fuscipes TaxID=488301 RepID=A0AAW1DSR6_9HEMI
MLFKKTIYWEVNLLFTISHYFGLAPFHYNFKPSPFYILISISFLIITFSDFIFMIIYMETINDTYVLSKFSLILERSQLIIIVTSVIISIIKPLYNIRTFNFIAKTLDNCDNNLKEVGIFISHNRIYSIVLISIKLFSVSVIFICDIILFNTTRNISAFAMEYICTMPLYFNNIVEAQFMVLLNSVQKRFNILTENIILNKNRNYLQKIKQMNVFTKVYNNLIDVCEKINTLYSLQILLIISSIFIITTANLYHVIEKVIKYLTEKKYNDYNLLIMLTYRILLRSTEVWALITSCVNTQEKSPKDFLHLLFIILDKVMFGINMFRAISDFIFL